MDAGLACVLKETVAEGGVGIGGIGVVEEAEAELEAKHIAHGIVYLLDVHLFLLEEFLGVVGIGKGHHVGSHASVEGLFGRLLEIFGHAVGHQLSYGAPVGAEESVVGPLITQNVNV